MLSTAQLDRFHEDGFLVIPEVLSARDLAPVENEYAATLDAAAHRLHELGRLSATHSDLPFPERYMALVADHPEIFYYLGISLPLDYLDLDPEYVRVHTGPALFRLLSHPAILDIVESVLGEEIALNPVQQVRLQPPQRILSGSVAEYSNIGLTTWHQDFGAVMGEAKDTEILTVWISMTDATEDVGCLVAIPGSHREQTLTAHCPGRRNAAENYIPQALLDRHDVAPVALPCRRGSVVLLTRFTEHSALPNTSDSLRWSFDLRYQRVGAPTGRPAFPSFVLRSASDSATEVRDPAEYANRWEETRRMVVSGAVPGPLYEQGRWLANVTNPMCA